MRAVGAACAVWGGAQAVRWLLTRLRLGQWGTEWEQTSAQWGGRTL